MLFEYFPESDMLYIRLADGTRDRIRRDHPRSCARL